MSQIAPLIHTRSARTRGAYAALGVSLVIWFALGAIQTHWIILAVLIIPPSLVAWDLMKNDIATFEMGQTHLSYALGSEQHRVGFEQIEIVRLNRRLDFSWRVTLRLKNGQKLRIPPPCLPPMEAFEQALTAREIKIDRILFAFAG